MKMIVFAGRNLKELVRDKLNLFFGLLFPLIILVLLWAIGKNIPGAPGMFALNSLTPGIAVFGLSFVSLFSGMLIAKDRSSSFLVRLYSSPLTAKDYILGYALPLVPLSVAQTVICFATALVLGLDFTVNIFIVLAVNIVSAILFISIGLLCGSIFNDKQVGGICGALLTNLTAWLSGVWFDVSLLGKGFGSFAKVLPFYNAVEAARCAYAGDYSGILAPVLIVFAYSVAMFIIASACFKAKMKD